MLLSFLSIFCDWSIYYQTVWDSETVDFQFYFWISNINTRLEHSISNVQYSCFRDNNFRVTPDSVTTISSSIVENIKLSNIVWTSICNKKLSDYYQPSTIFESVCKKRLFNYYCLYIIFRLSAGDKELNIYYLLSSILEPAYKTDYYYSRKKNNYLKSFFIKKEKDCSAISTVKYYKHSSFTWLSIKESISLNKTFRAIYDTQNIYIKSELLLQDLLSDIDQIISSFKKKYTERSAAEFWAFWKKDRFKSEFI